MKNAVNWFEIYTSDFERAKKFYSQVFKCEFTEMPMSNENHPDMRYALFPGDQNAAGCGGALVYMQEAQPGIGGTMVYVATEEINDELSRVEAAGGKIFRAKQDIGPSGFIALVQDTEGNMIGLHSNK